MPDHVTGCNINGKVVLTASSKGLESASLEINIK